MKNIINLVNLIQKDGKSGRCATFKKLSFKTKSLAILSLLSAAAFTSCDMVNEELPPCAVIPNTITTVNFVYDYNMFREDLFNEHAGTAHLYVFDQDSVFLFDRSVSRNDMPPGVVDFSMEFDTTYIKPGKLYYMVAMAQGNHSGYEWSTVATPGFQIPIEHEMVPGVSKIRDYRIVLDRDSDSYADIGIVNYRDAYGDNREMLDTLWSTKPKQIQKVEIPYIQYVPQVEEYEVQHYEVTIPMMRITNAITVNILHDSFDETFDPNRYNVLIDFPNGNGTIGFTGETLPNRELFYRALRKEMVPYQYSNGNAQVDGTKSTRAKQEYSLQSTFGVSRLQTTDNSSLQIRLADTNEMVLKIGDEDADIASGKSFAQWLADYFDSRYDSQEFLDREYNFTIDVHLDDKFVWDWYQVNCNILGWGVRVYNYIPR